MQFSAHVAILGRWMQLGRLVSLWTSLFLFGALETQHFYQMEILQEILNVDYSQQVKYLKDLASRLLIYPTVM